MSDRIGLSTGFPERPPTWGEVISIASVLGAFVLTVPRLQSLWWPGVGGGSVRSFSHSACGPTRRSGPTSASGSERSGWEVGRSSSSCISLRCSSCSNPFRYRSRSSDPCSPAGYWHFSSMPSSGPCGPGKCADGESSGKKSTESAVSSRGLWQWVTALDRARIVPARHSYRSAFGLGGRSSHPIANTPTCPYTPPT